MKKSHFILLLSTSLMFALNGCTSKYQTNKLPEEEKINLPSKKVEKRYYLNQEIKDDFEKYVINEFNNGINKKQNTKKKENSNIPKNIWIQGYKLDKKRY